MVKLEEVDDEDLVKPQEGPEEGEDEWDTDSDSDAESLPDDETLLDRLSALKDILPPSQRRRISSLVSTTTSWIATGGIWTGNALWVVSTGALLLGVPWALAYVEEQQYIEMEREARLQEQGSQLLTTGATSEAQPAL